MTDILLRLVALGALTTVALAICHLAVRHLDPATALSASPRTRTRLRWHLRHATPALTLTAAATAALLLAAVLLD
jgi:hypothetical protein